MYCTNAIDRHKLTTLCMYVNKQQKGVPGEAARRAILQVLLRQALPPPPSPAPPPAGSDNSENDEVTPTPLDLDEADISAVAARAHGFVGADLLLVCKEAAMRALRRRRESGDIGNGSGGRMTREDLLAGLRRVRPSALREVAVEVPRVRWSDIGGMDDVKRGLRECVEWPLTRPEAFVRMGIAPPKGVLLYGPPGCSKTLMARALATESGMNFLAVKVRGGKKGLIDEGEILHILSVGDRRRDGLLTLLFGQHIFTLYTGARAPEQVAGRKREGPAGALQEGARRGYVAWRVIFENTN